MSVTFNLNRTNFLKFEQKLDFAYLNLYYIITFKIKFTYLCDSGQ